MQRPKHEVATVIRHFGQQFIKQYNPNSFTIRTLDALLKCRTSYLGGHKEKCDCCGKERISYNSCRNRHCPKCQGSKQTFWVENRINEMLPVKHFHIVFTIPEKLNSICMLNSKWFYNTMFECVWSTLRSFGYTHYGVETGAICQLHTWGENLCFHPHIHCIVPSAGLTIKGRLKHIGRKGKYLYPVRMLSVVFRGKLLEKIKKNLHENNKLTEYQLLLDELWSKPWVVFCESPMESPVQIVKYLASYIHRVAISNYRIKEISDEHVVFSYKDYEDNGNRKTIRLTGVEFLRRFCLHILPYRFVKIRYYGIMSSKMKNMFKTKSLSQKPTGESSLQRFKRLTGIDIQLCPFCKKGCMQRVERLPRIRSPGNTIYQICK